MVYNENGEVDVMATPIKELWKDDIEWIENRIFFLEQEGRLCRGTGEEVIAEFGFKGNYDDVLRQLKELLETVNNNPYIETDKFEIRDRMIKYAEYKQSHRDIYMDKAKDAMKKKTMEGITEAVQISHAKRKLHDLLHEKKECICFLN
jgi:hypothetical protein